MDCKNAPKLVFLGINQNLIDYNGLMLCAYLFKDENFKSILEGPIYDTFENFYVLLFAKIVGEPLRDEEGEPLENEYENYDTLEFLLKEEY
jgi:hypothetical protein